MSRSGRDDPRPVADALGLVARDLGMPAPAVVGALLERWPEVVGEHLAGHSRPRSILDGVLTIAVEDPAWATPLRYLHETLLERCATLFGAGLVTSVRVIVQRLESAAADAPADAPIDPR